MLLGSLFARSSANQPGVGVALPSTKLTPGQASPWSPSHTPVSLPSLTPYLPPSGLQISHFKIPRYIVFVTNYPLTTSGKVCKVKETGEGSLGSGVPWGPTSVCFSNGCGEAGSRVTKSPNPGLPGDFPCFGTKSLRNPLFLGIQRQLVTLTPFSFL